MKLIIVSHFLQLFLSWLCLKFVIVLSFKIKSLIAKNSNNKNKIKKRVDDVSIIKKQENKFESYFYETFIQQSRRVFSCW